MAMDGEMLTLADLDAPHQRIPVEQQGCYPVHATLSPYQM